MQVLGEASQKELLAQDPAYSSDTNWKWVRLRLPYPLRSSKEFIDDNRGTHPPLSSAPPFFFFFFFLSLSLLVR